MITEKELLNFLLSPPVKKWLLSTFPEIRNRYKIAIKKFVEIKVIYPPFAVLGEVPNGAVSMDFHFHSGTFSIMRYTVGIGTPTYSECPHKLRS